MPIIEQKDPSTPDSPAGGPTPDSGGGNFNKAAFIFAVIVIVCAIIYHFR